MRAGYDSRCRLIVSTAYPVHAWGTDSNRSSGIRLRLVRIELVFRCTLLTCYLVLKRTPRFRFYLAFGYEDALLEQLIPIRHLFYVFGYLFAILPNESPNAQLFGQSPTVQSFVVIDPHNSLSIVHFLT